MPLSVNLTLKAVKEESMAGTKKTSSPSSVRVSRTIHNELKAIGRSAPSVRGDRNVQGQNKAGAGKKHP